ncbi:MAG TPA: anti-sigma factor antagonist [Candidatus Latescibacteria bacterium]|nr:anti-sigma factor antagonist [Candidatus Latescibacterota bacterium]
MQLNVRDLGDIKVISLEGMERATVEIAEDFKKALVEIIEGDSQKLVVDLSGQKFVDSSFLGALVVGLKRATAKGGNVKLVGLQPTVRSMFDLTRLSKVFEVFDTEEEALQSFSR